MITKRIGVPVETKLDQMLTINTSGLPHGKAFEQRR